MTSPPRSPWIPDEPDTPNIVPPAETVRPPELERAEYDVLIDRPELAAGAATFIAAGDVIPPALAGRARRLAQPESKAPSTRRRSGA